MAYSNHKAPKTKEEEKKTIWLTMDVIKTINAQRQAALDFDVYFPDVSGRDLMDWQKNVMGLN